MIGSTPVASTLPAASIPHPTGVVFVVDDDISVRESVDLLIRWAGLDVELFANAEEFLSRRNIDAPSCLILDVDLPGLSGLELQRRLTESGQDLPTIFITGHGDIPMTVQAMKAGAIEFLTKPFVDDDLLSAVEHAHRTQSRRTRRRGGIARAPRPLRLADAARASGDGPGGLRLVEQAGGRRTRHERDHSEGTSRSGDAEDAGGFAARPGEDGCHAKLPLTVSSIT